MRSIAASIVVLAGAFASGMACLEGAGPAIRATNTHTVGMLLIIGGVILLVYELVRRRPAASVKSPAD